MLAERLGLSLPVELLLHATCQQRTSVMPIAAAILSSYGGRRRIEERPYKGGAGCRRVIETGSQTNSSKL